MLENVLLKAFVRNHPSEAARAIESMDSASASEIVQALPEDVCAELLRWLAPVTAAAALEHLTPPRSASVLSAARRHVAAAVLRVSNPSRRASTLEHMSTKARAEIQQSLRYGENAAGALMDPEVRAVSETSSVEDTLEQMRRSPQYALYYIYVVAADQTLVGVVNIRQLMQARPEKVIGLLATRPAEAVSARSSWRVVAAHPGWTRFHALPVVDDARRFVGVIRYDVMRGLEQRLVGTATLDQAAETGAALGELYGIGLRGVVESASTLLLGTAATASGGNQ